MIEYYVSEGKATCLMFIYIYIDAGGIDSCDGTFAPLHLLLYLPHIWKGFINDFDFSFTYNKPPDEERKIEMEKDIEENVKGKFF